MRLPVLLVLAVLVFGCRVRETAETKEPSEEHQSIVVRVKPAQRQKMSQVVEALGFCEALLDRAATVAPAVEGQVLRILAKPGDVVKAGQPLVQLDSRLAEANLREKKAARDALVASLEVLQAPLRPAEQKGYQLAIEDAKVGVAKATAVVARLQPLLQRGEIPPQQMFDAKLALDQARVQQEKAENEFRVQMLGARREAIEEAKRHVDAAETAVATARLQCDLLTIRAPIDGVLDKITCRLGQTVAGGTPLGEVLDLRQLNALVWLPARDARLVRAGQQALVRASGLAEDRAIEDQEINATRLAAAGTAACGGIGPTCHRPLNRGCITSSLPGRVESVGQAVDLQTGNFPVRVLFDNVNRRLGLGQSVVVAITVCEKKDALAVPADAVFDLDEGTVLHVVRGEKSVVLHPRVGVKDKKWVEVQGTDLKAGEPVIVEGGWSLPEGTEVKARPEEDSGAATPAQKPPERKP